MARACFRLDPVSLVHGVFFARKGWPWQPRIARAVTSFIEASGVKPAVSGGVKRDVVINEAKDGATAEGYGTVPHHRVEYTADEITAYFTVDHAQFRSYGLSEPATALLEALADFEIATLLDQGLRLRTRCDLVVKEVRGERPDAAEAAQRIAEARRRLRRTNSAASPRSPGPGEASEIHHARHPVPPRPVPRQPVGPGRQRGRHRMAAIPVADPAGADRYLAHTLAGPARRRAGRAARRARRPALLPDPRNASRPHPALPARP